MQCVACGMPSSFGTFDAFLCFALPTAWLVVSFFDAGCRINEGMHFPVDVVGSHVIAFVLSYSIIFLGDLKSQRVNPRKFVHQGAIY